MTGTDVLVIGAGLSGLMAAYSAAKAGKQVKVVAKGLGALHWIAGTVDVLGYFGDDRRPVKRPEAVMRMMALQQPNHPYSIAGVDNVLAALDDFVALAKELGLPYGGAATPGDNLLLPSPVGAARPAFLAPQAQLNGDLGRPEPMLIVGFEHMRDFYPELIAENLRKQGFQARAALLPLRLVTARHDANNIHLALELDDRERRAKLGAELKRLVKPGERIGLPAIVGMDEHPAALADLQKQAGAVIFEIPTLPPSAPGLRLFQRMRAKLQGMGVRIEANMEVCGVHVTAPTASGGAGKVEWIETETSARPLKHRATNYVLATGGILGGGFNSDHTGRIWEVVFDLPLTIPQRRYEWFRPSFMTPEGHPVFNGGVAVNGSFQPVDGGKPVYNNLWAAGGALDSVDPILQRSMEGIAIATGVAAGRAAAQAFAQGLEIPA